MLFLSTYSRKGFGVTLVRIVPELPSQALPWHMNINQNIHESTAFTNTLRLHTYVQLICRTVKYVELHCSGTGHIPANARTMAEQYTCEYSFQEGLQSAVLLGVCLRRGITAVQCSQAQCTQHTVPVLDMAPYFMTLSLAVKHTLPFYSCICAAVQHEACTSWQLEGSLTSNTVRRGT